MAHIVVHRLDARAMRRIGRIEQVRALAPFPERADMNLWDRRADRYVHLMPAAIGGELGAVYMQIPEQEETPGAPLRFKPPASTRSPSLSAASARGVPDQLCYQLHARGGGPGTPANVSTPPLPWPCVIVGANLQWFGTASADSPTWGLMLTDADYTGQFVQPTGEPLIELISGVIPGTEPNPNVHPTSPVPIPASAATETGAMQIQATQLIGKLIHSAGRRLTFTAHHGAGGDETFDLTLTLQQIGGARAAATFIPAAQRAPRPPAIDRSTGRPHKPPIPPTPAPGECIINPQTALQRLQLERNGEAWFRQRYRGTIACGFPPIAIASDEPPRTAGTLAEVLQILAHGGTGLPITPYRIGPGDTAIAAGQIQFESLRQIEARKALERASAGPLVPVTGPLGGG